VLASRLPRWAADRVEVVGPTTVPVAVLARVAYDSASTELDLGALRRAVEQAMANYLDPRTGGPQDEGWLASEPGGEGSVVAASDLARRVAKVPGVVRVLEITLTTGGGSPCDQIVLGRGDVAVAAPDGLRAEFGALDERAVS
jgi:hypothetical protein